MNSLIADAEMRSSIGQTLNYSLELSEGNPNHDDHGKFASGMSSSAHDATKSAESKYSKTDNHHNHKLRVQAAFHAQAAHDASDKGQDVAAHLHHMQAAKIHEQLNTHEDRMAAISHRRAAEAHSAQLAFSEGEERDDRGRWTAGVSSAIAATEKAHKFITGIDGSKYDKKQFDTMIAKSNKAHDAALEGRHGDALGYHLAIAKIANKLNLADVSKMSMEAAGKHGLLPALLQTEAGAKAETLKETNASGNSAKAIEASKVAGGIDSFRQKALADALATNDHDAAKAAHISIRDRHDELALSSKGVQKKAHIAASAANWDAAMAHILASKKGNILVAHKIEGVA